MVKANKRCEGHGRGGSKRGYGEGIRARWLGGYGGGGGVRKSDPHDEKGHWTALSREALCIHFSVFNFRNKTSNHYNDRRKHTMMNGRKKFMWIT